jgi:hypothetical protein
MAEPEMARGRASRDLIDWFRTCLLVELRVSKGFIHCGRFILAPLRVVLDNHASSNGSLPDLERLKSALQAVEQFIMAS